MSNLIVLSRLEASRYRGNEPYVVISIRSPGDSVPKLLVDPFRIARINLAIYDTTPEWEAVSSTPVAAMTTANAERIAAFVARYWGHCLIVVQCKFGISRSAGIVAGILDAVSLDASVYERAPYEPNLHCRHLVRKALALHVASGSLALPSEPSRSTVAFTAFAKIAERWGLRRAERVALLATTECSIDRWVKDPALASLSREQLERVSYVLGIFTGLHEILGDTPFADEWIRMPNADFGHACPLDHMLAGNIGHLADVRRYVDRWRAGT
jgi:predicted protein tyrosine phosphatase